MNPENIAKLVAAVLTPLLTVVSLASRKRRLRNEIRENLALLQELQKDNVLREHTPVAGWLQGKVAVDVARLAGQPLGTPKRPIPKGAVAFAVVMGVAFAVWTYWIVRDGFVWYAVFPGTVAFLMVMSVIGMFTNRELPPAQEETLPPGAVPVRSNTATEQITTAVAIASSGEVNQRFDDDGSIGVAFRFLRAMRNGRFEEGVALADENWRLCRIQAWLWNNRDHLGTDLADLNRLAELLLKDSEPQDVWQSFVLSETQNFVEAWASIDPDRLGAGSRRRRIARDYDLVILVPLGDSGGYFVTAATMVPNAMTFVMHRSDGRWLLASHLGTAPPQPGWPPAWWATGDPSIEALPNGEPD